MPFRPGQSGNPAGRPRGSRNKATIIAEKLFDDSAGDLTKAAIARALDGDPAMLRACMDRIAPRLRRRPVDFDMPPLVTLADAPPAINAIAQGLAHGEFDRDEAAVLLRIVREFMRALAAVERAKRAAGLGAQAVQETRAGRAAPTSCQRGSDEPSIVPRRRGRAGRAMPLRRNPDREAPAMTRHDAVGSARIAHRLLPTSSGSDPRPVAHRNDAEDRCPRRCRHAASASAACASSWMRLTIERKPFERCGVRCSRRPSFSNTAPASVATMSRAALPE